MVENEYAIAYSEVLEILKYIPLEDYNKIPKNKIELFQKNAAQTYNFKYNPCKTLEEQNVSNITKGIIILLFRDYWATEIQREKIIDKQNYDRRKLEEEKREKYNVDEIFNKEQNENMSKLPESSEENLDLLEYKESKWYKKIFEKILRIFKKN
jgi:hypothetical protein